VTSVVAERLLMAKPTLKRAGKLTKAADVPETLEDTKFQASSDRTK
jgi:hypothetical protein